MVEEKFKYILNEVDLCLKKYGYVRKGLSFFINHFKNWGIINFQKSRSSDKNEICFTINMGVSSEVLRKKVDLINLDFRPDIERCHWQDRIGFLMPQKRDYWWQIDESSNIEDVKNEILNTILNIALPLIGNYILDEGLEKLWSEGPGNVTELQRYMYLTTLLWVHKRDSLDTAVERLREISKGKGFEETAKNHIKTIERNG